MTLEVWQHIRQEAKELAECEPMLASFFHSTILKHQNLGSALSYLLANKLANPIMPAISLREIIEEAYQAEPNIIDCAACDIKAVRHRDPAVELWSTPLLYLKGFHAIQSYRITHYLWNQNRKALALYLQNQISVAFDVDIHPAAKIGHGIMFDHATGIVVGETSVIENDVSILQGVTLGGTGKESGDRHPKVREGVMIGAGTKILGNIEVGKYAKIGANSVVLQPVPEYATAAGVPARIVGKDKEAKELAECEPMLASFFHSTILKHQNLGSALSYLLANKLANPIMPAISLREIIEEAYQAEPNIIDCAACDIKAVRHRDPAVELWSTPLLYLKGFHAIQSYRITHYLWNQNRKALALYLQNQISVAFDVDIHPAAKIGHGIMFDHATGIVVGETSVIENDVSILQGVTLGGTGKESGDRHPKVREGVMIGAGAKILGNIEVGKYAKIGANSVVLQPVPEYATAAGVPARIVGKDKAAKPAFEMNQYFIDDDINLNI